MAIPVEKEGKEFPLPPKCNMAWKVGNEWHRCHLPTGHKGPCECSHYIREKEPLFAEAKNDAQRIKTVEQ